MTREEIKECRELRAVIQAITDFPSVSVNLTYLRKRAADLRRTAKGVALGFDVGGTQLVDVVGIHDARALGDLLGGRRAAMLAEIAKPKCQSPVEILKRALDIFAVDQGYGRVVAQIQRDERK